jgi:Spy/CpxP family protein refolding chaperone
MKRAVREAKQAEKVVEEMRALGASGSKDEKEVNNNGQNLSALILANQKKRGKQQVSF